ncbi:DUF5696 domain-containing protein [Paenibacillus nasutitermitis]|uniref:Uncharacterized protein n=1 Tax=Paenibacillus nasutitermitis TaxID=1652958 RepID=A0A916Z775_9BACL|nr:DUF5696 domain-containing protein [Paenibacillus nasutitermitis]GGD79812.1 hypothetical protein GCM10010911_42390 [Paenibacillus nasutitermitis]
MRKQWLPGKRQIVPLLAVLLILLALTQLRITFYSADKEGTAAGSPAGAVSGGTAQTKEAVLPQDEAFEQVSETGALRLKLDPASGHFIVENKRNGQVWRSYPNPDQWQEESVGGMWRSHLAAPLMLQFKDFTRFSSQPKETNFIDAKGSVEQITPIPGGVRFVLSMPSLGMDIPIQIRLEQDFVETKIIDSGLKERLETKLMWLRLYPFFGAEHSAGQEGYLFIPDGSGALIDFNQNGQHSNRIYQESIYGPDSSYEQGPNTRERIVMPVFGLRSENRAFLAVAEEGEAHAQITASPAGVFSDYNWVTAQQLYRAPFYQVVSKSKDKGYMAYSRDDRFEGDRTLRYYLLDESSANYVGMASRYRQYLMEDRGIARLDGNGGKLPLYVTLLGGDTEQGLVKDRYLQATTTSEAKEIVQQLHESGIGNLSITYKGWQAGGYGKFGGYRAVAAKLGGNEGMKSFIDYAHTLEVPVFLGINYSANTGVQGFKARYHAIQNKAGTIMDRYFGDYKAPLASVKYSSRILSEDIPHYQSLGADGLVLIGSAQALTSDYNNDYHSSRAEGQQTEDGMFASVKSKLGALGLENANFYALPAIEHIRHLADDYSYDLFSTQAVPFAQIALHGLVEYTSEDENEQEQTVRGFLKDIEYGAIPSYTFTYSDTRTLQYAQSLKVGSSSFKDWKERAIQDYRRYEEALGPVQHEFIVGHRQLSEGVMETEYASGRRIVVNYNSKPYRSGNLVIPGQDYRIVGEEVSHGQ